MKSLFTAIVVLTLSLLVSSAQAQWISLSKSLNEVDIQSLVVDAKDPQIIYAGSQRRIYKSTDGGDTWGQVLGLHGSDNHVRFIYVDPHNPKNIYVGTDKGIQKSEAAGNYWKPFFAGVDEKSKNIFCMASTRKYPDILWIGTGRGLVRFHTRDGIYEAVQSLPAMEIYSILPEGAGDQALWVASDKGIYRSSDAAAHWERVLIHAGRQEDKTGETQASLQQFGLEETEIARPISNLLYLENGERFFAATPAGIWEGAGRGGAWRLLDKQNFPSGKINFIAKSSRTFYAATDRGVLQWDPGSGSFHEIYEGLGSKEVHALTYSPAGDYLLAGTRGGVFKYSHPEWHLVYAGAWPDPMIADQILHQFDSEPGVGDIQNAAIRYAEVHPDKIREWRAAASRKALLPTLSLGTRRNQNQNIDVDRGGTTDPDRFIRGPDEKSMDWNVGVSWNLGGLIWNDDQTTIDTRSRLMVELRDDILNEVTHLYFERRRLEIQMAALPPPDLPAQIENEIRLQELTAGIDALTGGYLSRNLGKPGMRKGEDGS